MATTEGAAMTPEHLTVTVERDLLWLRIARIEDQR